MELFEFIKVIFTDPKQYSSATPGEKRKHYFHLQRRFCIMFPMQANVLQHTKINQSAVIDFWQRYLRSSYSYIPGWMYTKGVKKAKEVKEKKVKVSTEVIRDYCKTFNIDRKSVNDALEFFPDKMTAELQKWEKMMKQK